MQLTPGERSVLSYFPTSNKARQAVDDLKAAGINEVQLDRVSRFGDNNDATFNNPINRANTVTGPTLFSKDNFSEDPAKRVLMGADPSASGYGCDDYGMAGGKAFMVAVVTNEDKLDQAVQIIKKHDGMV
ncbi:hypothetical protein Psfp_02773 [Pelotomaculum sp. FP]|uniref:hypothetical protein n=1 Tax=Pelotomaculum sp. FP TaxID=261474 RepID=UPI001066426B|nr:hypothetical protein [Pelotomaculum sp. FP]TEB14630.1 hypothetical protein Psfp_02773 [Pelotomaculum sp. FP]